MSANPVKYISLPLVVHSRVSSKAQLTVVLNNSEGSVNLNLQLARAAYLIR